jgi:hypothetical protein
MKYHFLDSGSNNFGTQWPDVTDGCDRRRFEKQCALCFLGRLKISQ